MKIVLKVFSFLLLSSMSLCSAYNVGLMIVATGKYVSFVPPLLDSARKHFCPGHKVTFFVFTEGQLPAAPDCVRIEQSRLGWPYDTMMRFEMYAHQADVLKEMDYLFACDADMLFVDTVGDEILCERVGTLHPGFVGSRGTYETRPDSLAYIPRQEGKVYFAGGFYGGRSENVLRMCAELTRRIYDDLGRGIIAVWHDESHLNRYFIDNEPTVVLPPAYCYPEYPDGRPGPWKKWAPKLIAIFKHSPEQYKSPKA
jgi:histo-blood group ABO system transferase